LAYPDRKAHGTAVAVSALIVAAVLGVEESIARPALRCAAEVYAAVAATVSVLALRASGAGWAAIIAAAMIAPVIFFFARQAARSAAVTRRAWTACQERADVGHSLWALGKKYRILEHLPMSPGREDHVAIGPNGIFVVATCGGGGRVTASARRVFVDGRPPARDVLDDCRMDALRVQERVRRLLGRSLPVHPVLCFARGLVAVGQEIVGVKIVHASRLMRLVASTAAKVPLAEADIDAALMALMEAPAEAPAASARVRAERPRPCLERRLTLAGRAPAHNHGGR
jgi:hypothetical protein